VALFDKRRNEPGDPEGAAVEGTGPAGGVSGGSRPVVQTERRQATPVAGGKMANIGKSIRIKGDLSGEEDLVVEGHAEGKIELPNNELTIGANGSVDAEVHAKTVVVIGKITGNVTATDRIEVQATGLVNGDVNAPRLVVQEGAVINGSIEMGGRKSTPVPAAAPHVPAPSPEKKALA
jgi:cytoskeletal protein CcmA (bactofilin family)